jgi:hypothetical protein
VAEKRAPLARELFTEEQIAEFLSLIREGISRHVAARRIGTTGTVMKRLARPNRDPVFAREYAEAYAEGRAFYEARLEAESRQRALNGSDRMLEVELATHHPKYAHLRRDRVSIKGQIDHEHSLVLNLNPAVLDTLPEEKLLELRRLIELGGELVDDDGIPGVLEIDS